MKPLSKCLVALVICSGVAVADDWPTFRGNSMLQGRAETLSTELQPLWLFEVEEGIEGGAAIVDGVVYVGALDGFLEGWHELFGSPDSERSDNPRDDFLVRIHHIAVTGFAGVAFGMVHRGW